MRTITTTTNVYKFEELSPESQANALDKHREWLVNDPYWYTCIEEDWNDKLSNLGIENPKISFSGFWNQGDGAVFTSKNIDLIKLLDGLGMQTEYKYIYDLLIDDVMNVSSSINRISNYYDHEGTAKLSIDFEQLNDDYESEEKYNEVENKAIEMLSQLEKELESWRREMCKELYYDLMQEYEMLQSDDVLKETFVENEYEFTEDGEIYN